MEAGQRFSWHGTIYLCKLSKSVIYVGVSLKTRKGGFLWSLERAHLTFGRGVIIISLGFLIPHPSSDSYKVVIVFIKGNNIW